LDLFLLQSTEGAGVQFLPTTFKELIEYFCLVHLDFITFLLSTNSFSSIVSLVCSSDLDFVYSVAVGGYQLAAGSIHAIGDHGGRLLLLAGNLRVK
jgi:hypothetical protein